MHQLGAAGHLFALDRVRGTALQPLEFSSRCYGHRGPPGSDSPIFRRRSRISALDGRRNRIFRSSKGEPSRRSKQSDDKNRESVPDGERCIHHWLVHYPTTNQDRCLGDPILRCPRLVHRSQVLLCRRRRYFFHINGIEQPRRPVAEVFSKRLSSENRQSQVGSVRPRASGERKVHRRPSLIQIQACLKEDVGVERGRKKALCIGCAYPLKQAIMRITPARHQFRVVSVNRSLVSSPKLRAQ